MICVRLLPHIKGNVGFVFTKEDLHVIRNIIRENKVEAPAKAGAIAPVDVKVSPINTGLGPERTSFFQALAIPTRITRGKIEILVRQYNLGHKVYSGKYIVFQFHKAFVSYIF